MPALGSDIIELSVFCRIGRQTRYLILHRAPTEKLYPGIWQFITGRVEQGENGIDAALRELREETGLSMKALWVVPYIIQYYDSSADKVFLSPLFAAEVACGVKIRLSIEHDKFAWLPYREAVRNLVWPAQREGLKILNKFIAGRGKVSSITRIL